MKTRVSTDLYETILNEMVDQKTSPFYKCETTYLKNEDQNILFLQVKGTFYDSGFAIGFYHWEGIQSSINRVFKVLKRVGAGSAHKKLTNEELIEKAKSYHSNVPYHFLEKLRGVIDGCEAAGHPLENPADFISAIAYFEINEEFCCSMFAMNFPCTTDHTLHMSNSEYPFPVNYINYPLMMIFHPVDNEGKKLGHSYLSLGVAGVSGSITGINEKGLAISQIRASFLKGDISQTGIPYTYLLDEIFMSCSTAEQAITHLTNQPKTNPKYYIFSDNLNKTNSLKIAFTAPSYTKAWNANEMPEVSLISNKDFANYEPCLNAVFWADMATPEANHGPDKAYNKIYPNLGIIEEKKGLEITKSLGSKYLALSAFFNTTTFDIWLSYANASKSADNREYIHINLKKYFDLRI